MPCCAMLPPPPPLAYRQAVEAATTEEVHDEGLRHSQLPVAKPITLAVPHLSCRANRLLLRHNCNRKGRTFERPFPVLTKPWSLRQGAGLMFVQHSRLHLPLVGELQTSPAFAVFKWGSFCSTACISRQLPCTRNTHGVSRAALPCTSTAYNIHGTGQHVFGGRRCK